MEIETGDSGVNSDYQLHAHHRGIDGGPRWEKSLNIECDQCGSRTEVGDRSGSPASQQSDDVVEAIVSGEELVLVCHDCSNWYQDMIGNVIWVDQDTGEIRHQDWNLPFTLIGTANRW